MATNGFSNNVGRLLKTRFFPTQQNHCSTSSKAIKCWKWDINPVINPQLMSNIKYAVLILNRPITQSQEFIRSFWNNASVRITVDGGTRQWDKYISTLSDEVQESLRLPDLVTGDFDSITEEILMKYKQKGCKTVHTPDQNYTDFTKALMELNTYCIQNEMEMDHVIAVGQCSGRLDQILGNIQTLYLERDKKILSPNSRIYILSDDSISWLLSPGDHVIDVPEDTRKHGRAWCSLVPIGESCQSVTSSGLKWNLDNQPLQFGDLVSTSNTFDGSDKVNIKCSHTLLWSMRIPSVAGP